MLTNQQVEAYKEDGYLLVEGVLRHAQLAALRRVTDEFVESSRSVTESNDVYDIGDGHSPAQPVVRRIKWPHLQHPLYSELVEDERILGIVSRLIGPNVRLHGSKLNTKFAGSGPAVEWHQDWAFYPHTNDDILAIGIFLDDIDVSNGPLMVLPKSHRGPVYDHHTDGGFVGAIDAQEIGPDLSQAVALTGRAGSMSIHHVRLVHGSDVNKSDRPRRLLLYELRAADAWPLAGTGKEWRGIEHFNSLLLAGTPTAGPRMETLPVRIPLPIHGDHSTIYTAQKSLRRRFFETPAGQGLAPAT